MKRIIPIIILAWLIQPFITLGSTALYKPDAGVPVNIIRYKQSAYIQQAKWQSFKPLPKIQSAATAPAPKSPSKPQAQGYPMGANYYRDQIFFKESRDNPAAVNPGGCIGLGQDCNLWMVRGHDAAPVCLDWATDIPCQLKYWDWYANKIYGGWAQAWAFRSSHNYW